MMKIYPKISIVTPVYNRVQYLEQTILSVLSQNYPNLEYIIIDAGSTDGTVDIIKKYESQLAYWISEPDKGMYHAIQKGFDKSTGEIMAWLNSDDMYHLNSLWIIADIFSELNSVNWIIGIPSLYNEKGLCVKVFQPVKWSRKKILIGDFRWIQQESVFFRRTLWDKSGNSLNLSYKLAADFELWTRFFQYANLYTVNTVLSGFRLHGNQLSINQGSVYEKEVCSIYNQLKCKPFLLRKLFLVQKWLPKRISFFFIPFWDRIYRLPKVIYYDFDKNQWQK